MLDNLLPKLRVILAELYPEEVSSHRVAADAGLSQIHITFCSRAIDNWYNILTEAQKQHKINEIIKVAVEEYPDNPNLRQVIDFINGEKSNKASYKGWQAHEKAGDEFRRRSFVTNSLIESRKLWLQSKEKYQLAISLLESIESIEKVRLHRKITECLRKVGETEFAEQQWLLAHKLLKNLNYEPQVEKRKEEAYLLLEEAYIEFSKQKWPKLQAKSEDIIRDYDGNQYQDIRIVVGSAYNLLAIALTNLDYNRHSLSPKKCWNLAEEKLSGLDSFETKRLLQDIKINLAVHLRDRGDCDLAIQKFEEILDKHIVNSTEIVDKLCSERQVDVKHNLAVAYFDRYQSTDIDKADELAKNNLESSIHSNDLENWSSALQLQLNIIIEQIRQVSNSTKFELLEKAKNLYKELKRAKKIDEDKNWESSDEHAELHRLFTEIYIAIGQIENAVAEFEIIKEWKPFSGQDWANFLLTRALVYQEQKEFKKAELSLNDAKQQYKSLKNMGLVVETNIRLADLYMSYQNWEETRRVLCEAKKLAEELYCQNRITRIENLLKALAQKGM